MKTSGGERTALVVGGGIGGLAAALALRHIGWRVTVLESAPAFREVGAGISLQPNGLRALDALGIGAQVRAAGFRQRGGGVRTPSGRWLARLDGALGAERHGTPVLSLHRAELHRVLRTALPAQALVTGAEVTAVEQGRGTASVQHTAPGGPATREAALVVGADGVHSRVRAELWPDAPGPVYSGSTVWRGITAQPVETTVDLEQTWGPGAELGFTRLPGGRIEWHATANAPVAVRHRDELGEVHRRFGAWHDPIPALLAATPPRAVLHHDVFELATPLPSYVRGRVALLGDAAHAMTPHLGQGACQAVEDAVVLAAALADHPDLPTALAHYDRQRRPRSQHVARAARRTGRIGQQLANPVAVAARNATIRLTPPRAVLRSTARYTDWRPPALDRA